MLTKAYIPYNGYYSTPFCRWQGSMANEHAIHLAANTTKRWFTEKNWDPEMFDYLYLGMTIGQHQLAGLLLHRVFSGQLERRCNRLVK